MKTKGKLTFVDLFSGAGGLLEGFLQAGYTPLFSVENWKPAIETHKYNFPKVPIIDRDIREIEKKDIQKILGGNSVDVLVGGPPCQGFSTIGNRDPKDQRNNLILEFVRFVSIIKPKVFLMENVQGLVSAKDGYYRDVLIKKFKSLGYNNVIYKVINAADFGVPQMRKRVFFIGTLDKKVHLDFPDILKLKDAYTTVGEAISDLVGKENIIANHIPMKHNPIVEKRISFIPEGGGLPTKDIPAELLRGSRSDYKNNDLKNFSHVYRRLHRKRPATTMVPGHNAFPLHPTENRALTVREAARIQTFPDIIEFKGTRQEQCILVGNAVPVYLAKVFAKHIKKIIK